MSSSYIKIDLADFDRLVGNVSTEVSSQAIGGRVLSCSDECASDLLKVHPAVSMKGQFGPNGALFDGWETRRHNPDHDWAIIKLGPPAATLSAFDIDTSHFSGNEGPAGSVEGVYSPEKEPTNDDPRWVSLLPVVPLGPSSRHVFTIPPTSSSYTHLRLRMLPDGGIARFRAYGIVSPIWDTTHAWDASTSPDAAFQGVEGQRDLAHAFNGGRSVYESDKHYGAASNLLLPGRGKDMGDGWETKRSRTPGHLDFVIVKLGAPGTISLVNIDTLHFLGNFPAGVELHAINSAEEVPSLDVNEGWTSILARTKVGPHKEHFYKIEQDQVFTHVRMTIYPDGGVKRLRVFGRRDGETSVAPRVGEVGSTLPTSISSLISTLKPSSPSSSIPSIAAEPLTSASFAPYGQVIQAFPSPSLAPASAKCTSANAGSAWKYHRLSVPQSSYPPGSGEVQAFSCFRAVPPEGFGGKEWKGTFEARMFERHAYTTQTFIPMGKDPKELESGGEGMLIIVAQNGQDDAPDPSTFKAFLASPAQGLTYNTGVWHHSVLTLVPTDFACLETQMSTDGDRVEDCEVRRKADDEPPFLTVKVE